VAEAREREQAAAAEARRAEGAALALELLAVSERADAAMREAASALAERAALARRLAGYGGNLNGLVNRARLAAAAGAAGLDQVLEVRRSPRSLHGLLADMDRKILAGVLGEAAPPEQPADLRFLPGQVGPHEIGRPAPRRPAPADRPARRARQQCLT
jgi:hypothetical protein